MQLRAVIAGLACMVLLVCLLQLRRRLLDRPMVVVEKCPHEPRTTSEEAARITALEEALRKTRDERDQEVRRRRELSQLVEQTRKRQTALEEAAVAAAANATQREQLWRTNLQRALAHATRLGLLLVKERKWSAERDGPQRVAVCITGNRLESLKVTGEQILEHLIRPLNANVFLVGPVTDGVGRELGQIFGHISGVDYGDQLDASIIKSNLAAVPDSKMKDAILASNFAQAGVLMGHMLRERCLRLVQSREKLFNFQYDYVVFTRPDMTWKFRHPNVTELDAAAQRIPRVVFAMDGPVWNGIQTQHIVLPRKQVDFVKSRWTGLLRGDVGRAVEVMLSQSEHNHVNHLNSERITLLTCLALGYTPVVFRAVAALRCVPIPKKSFLNNLVRGDRITCNEQGQEFKLEIGKMAVMESTRLFEQRQAWTESDFIGISLQDVSNKGGEFLFPNHAKK